MKITKFKTDFKRRKIPDLLVMSEGVLGLYKIHPATQGPRADFLPTDEALQKAIDNVRISYAGALKGDRDQKKARDRDVDVLIGHLITLAHYYETAGAKNPEFLLNTGFEEVTVQKSSARRMLEAAAALALWHSQHPATVLAKTRRVPYAKGYEMYFTDGDPTVEENWKYQGTHFRCSEMEIGGLEGGKIYSFRVRAVNPGGKGPWSPVGTIRAL